MESHNKHYHRILICIPPNILLFSLGTYTSIINNLTRGELNNKIRDYLAIFLKVYNDSSTFSLNETNYKQEVRQKSI